MRLTILFLTLSLLFVFPVTAHLQSPTDKWVHFSDVEGNFRVLTPEPMERHIRSVETALGEVEYHTFFHQPTSNARTNEMYMLSYCDYPASTVHEDSTDLIPEFFNATVDAAVLAVDGNLLYKSERAFRGHPGFIWKISYHEEQVYVKTHAFLVDNRYYALQTVTRSDLSLNPDIKRFMQSFRLLIEDQ